MAATQPVIFCDMDGVLADFMGHARAQGLVKADGGLRWDGMDHGWWATMPEYPGAKNFYDAMCRAAVVRFLTGPTLDEEAFSGKAQWVQNFAPERGKSILNDLIICRAENKHYLAKPHHILIDDNKENIADWIAAGGIGILHTGDFAQTWNQLRAEMKRLLAPPKHNAAAKPRFPKYGH